MFKSLLKTNAEKSMSVLQQKVVMKDLFPVRQKNKMQRSQRGFLIEKKQCKAYKIRKITLTLLSHQSFFMTKIVT